MANPTKCLTPGAIFQTRISTDGVSVRVLMPGNELKGLSEKEAEILETLIHNQLELVLRPFFVQPNKD